VRRFGRGLLIGPVVAPSQAAAQALIGHCLQAYAGQFIRLDILDRPGLGAWLAGLGLADVEPVRWMVRGTPPAPAGPGQLFALASQGLG
jgi:hypothetical protein